MGWLEAIGGMFEWASGSSIISSLVRVAAAFGLMRYLSKTQEAPINPSTTSNNRIQVPPSTENKIPVAYGSSYFNGTVVDVQLTNNNKTLYAVIVLCEKTGNLLSTGAASSITIDNIYLDNKVITFTSDGTTVDHVTDDTGVVDTSPGAGLMGIYLYKGSSANPMLPCQAGTTTPITGTVPSAAYSIMPGWDNTYSCSNTIFAIVKLNYDPSKGQHSIPNLKFHVNNTMKLPGDCLYDYMTNSLYGASIPAGLINTTSFTALNTYSNQTVTYSPYPAQPRYLINGLINTNQKVLNNMDLIAASAASYITYDISSGQWAVLIQKVTAKTFDFSDHNIVGQVNATGTALDTYYNSVEVQFPYAYLRDQSNYVRVDLATNVLNYNEPVNVLKTQYDLVNNVVQATILANIQLRQSREDLCITFKTDFSAYNVQLGDVIGLTNSTYGFTGKLFRVIKLVKAESETGELTIDVTALSYNDAVYTVSNINSFIPSIGAGSSIPSLSAIATPIAPTLTSSTISSQPSITVTATIPAGVVTDMEFWASSDGTTYKFQGSTRNDNSGAFTTGATTVFKTIELQTATWYFKVRAANTQTSSSFSPASTGLSYTYIQAPDVLPYNTPTVGSNGQPMSSLQGLGLGLIAAYVASQINWQGLGQSALTELQNLGVISPSQLGAIQTAITSNSAAANVVVKDEGTTITTGATSINFVGAAVTATASGTAVTVTINGVTGATGATGTGGASQCYIYPTTYYPHDKGTYATSVPGTDIDPWGSDVAPVTGSYYLRYGNLTGSLVKGTGNAKLYKSDGTLISTVPASATTISTDVVEIAFSSRDIGTDYYVLLDEGYVTNNGCLSAAISDPLGWNFNTPLEATASTLVNGSAGGELPVYCGNLQYSTFVTQQLNASGAYRTEVNRQSWIGVTFNYGVQLAKTGVITIKTNSGSTFQAFDLSLTFVSNKITTELVWVSGNTVYVNPTKDFTAGASYYLNITAGAVQDLCGTSGNAAITDSSTISWQCSSGPTLSAASLPTSGSANENGVVLNSTAALTPGKGSVHVFNASNTEIAVAKSTNAAVSFTAT